ncbi:mitochondrial glycoprotein [Lipomyces arxii]|uniref:mitochondrial glycoprotein n=1 Tax=Lipomyces arxii TaxID=56418 RepID=UPI0034CD2290
MASRTLIRTILRSAKPQFSTSFVASRSSVGARSFAYSAVAAAKHSGGKLAKPQKRAVSPVVELASVLDEEITFAQAELEAETAQDEKAAGLEYVKQAGFDIIAPEGSDVITLKKTAEDGVEITVKFNASTANPIFNDDYNQFDEEYKDEDEQPEEEFMDENGEAVEVPFRLFLTKPEVGTFALTGIAQFGALTIENAVLVKDSSLALSDSAEDEVKRRALYDGTPFHELDQKLQDAMTKYFESYGINDDLAEFIVDYAKLTDSQLYLNSLKDIKTFIQG